MIVLFLAGHLVALFFAHYVHSFFFRLVIPHILPKIALIMLMIVSYRYSVYNGWEFE